MEIFLWGKLQWQSWFQFLDLRTIKCFAKRNAHLTSGPHRHNKNERRGEGGGGGTEHNGHQLTQVRILQRCLLVGVEGKQGKASRIRFSVGLPELERVTCFYSNYTTGGRRGWRGRHLIFNFMLAFEIIFDLIFIFITFSFYVFVIYLFALSQRGGGGAGYSIECWHLNHREG
jgi:hypothetical protein